MKSPAEARFRLAVNARSLEIASLDAAEPARNAGFGGGLGAVGATVGGIGGGYNDSNSGAVTGGTIGAIAGAGLAMTAGPLVRDVTFMMITDIELVGE